MVSLGGCSKDESPQQPSFQAYRTRGRHHTWPTAHTCIPIRLHTNTSREYNQSCYILHCQIESISSWQWTLFVIMIRIRINGLDVIVVVDVERMEQK